METVAGSRFLFLFETHPFLAGRRRPIGLVAVMKFLEVKPPTTPLDFRPFGVLSVCAGSF